MSRFGFGFAGRGRNSLAKPVSAVVPATPSAGWNGVAGSGFGGSFGPVPIDPVRMTAKPACRLLVPPNQYFTDQILVGVLAMANHGGSLANKLGLEKVVVHYEGAAVEIVQPSFQTFSDANGNPVTYFGWWCRLYHTGVHGHANIYFEAVPKDPTMQRRVIGPYQFSPQPAVYDREFEVAATPAQITGQRYKTLAAVKSYIESLAIGVRPQNPRITITEGGNYEWTTAGGSMFGQGYLTVEATAPVTITTATRVQVLRPRYDGIRLKGRNITLDLFNYTQLYHEGSARNHWLDGITVTDSGGRYYLVNKGQRLQTGVRNGMWATECEFTNLQDFGGGLLLRGCSYRGGCRDVMTGSQCMVDNLIEDHSSDQWRTGVLAMTVQYSGSGTGTLSLSGSNDVNNRVFTAKVAGATVGTFTISNSNPAGNYDVADVVNWINGLGAGWSATLIDDSRRASAIIYLPSGVSPFTDVDVKSSAKDFYTFFDQHSDIWQSNAAGATENVIMWGTRAWDVATQNILIGGTFEIRDMFLVNCAFDSDESSPDYAVSFSQLSGVHKHVVLAHVSESNQSLQLRTGFTSTLKYNPDAYCAVMNSTFPNIRWDPAGPDADLRIADNHSQGAAPAGATGHTTGGTRASLFANAVEGDFTPAGALLTNLKTPSVGYDIRRLQRALTAPAGAFT